MSSEIIKFHLVCKKISSFLPVKVFAVLINKCITDQYDSIYATEIFSSKSKFYNWIDTAQLNVHLTQFELDCPGNGLDHPTHETLPAQLAGDMCVQLYSHTQTSAATLYYNRLSLILAR